MTLTMLSRQCHDSVMTVGASALLNPPSSVAHTDADRRSNADADSHADADRRETPQTPTQTDAGMPTRIHIPTRIDANHQKAPTQPTQKCRRGFAYRRMPTHRLAKRTCVSHFLFRGCKTCSRRTVNLFRLCETTETETVSVSGCFVSAPFQKT